MADKRKIKNIKTSPRWANSLPPEYETLLVGFNAHLTVEELVSYFKINEMRAYGGEKKPFTIPDSIKKIKIGCFTPNMFEHEDFREFWNTPVHSHQMYEYPKICNALKDNDFHKVQAKVYKDNLPEDADDSLSMDMMHPTLETLARLAQTQHLGFNLRMSELTSNSMMDRINMMKDPETYQHLREIAEKRRIDLPVKPPEFKIAQEAFCVKKIGSALEKAYYRTGQPKDVQAFLQDPNKFGINGVNDMKRTMIELPTDRKKQQANYMAVRNLFIVAVMSGELGLIHDEITDHVLYPPSERPSDLNPVCMIKGHMYHAGPQINGKGSIISSPTELQIALLPEHARNSTHDIYKQSRKKGISAEVRKLLDAARVQTFNEHLCEDIQQTRQKYLATQKIENDAVGKLVFASTNGFDMARHSNAVRNNAIVQAWREFPDELDLNDAKKNPVVIELNPSNRISPLVQQTIREIVQYEPEKAEQYEMRPASFPRLAPASLQ